MPLTPTKEIPMGTLVKVSCVRDYGFGDEEERHTYCSFIRKPGVLQDTIWPFETCASRVKFDFLVEGENYWSFYPDELDLVNPNIDWWDIWMRGECISHE